jgi:hypothetical protein
MRDAADLIRVLEAARELLVWPDNDYASSSWTDAESAEGELDEFIARLQDGASVDRTDLNVLFAAGGPIQEVGLASGWADAFQRLAADFSRASARFQWDD